MKASHFIVLGWMTFATLQAQTVPSLINYQGRLADRDGILVQGMVTNVVVEIWDAEIAGAVTYTEAIGDVPIAQGIYSFKFGSDFSGLHSALSLPEAWMQVSIDGERLNPRQRLISVPYAVMAGSVDGRIVIGPDESVTPKPGTLRWNGATFEGYTGTGWVPLSSPLDGLALDFVRVSDPGNPADADRGFGARGTVNAVYEMGTLEVNNRQYVAFLNAVDPDGLNTRALYNPSMTSNIHGGILFSGAAGSGQKYAVKSGAEKLPVVFVSFYDAMRFCNWLHNGASGNADTEQGAYDFEGDAAVPLNGTTVMRSIRAEVVIPNEDEWYKAAYFRGGLTYSLFPTGTASMNNSGPPGNTSSGNYGTGGLQPTGSYTQAPGRYGTFDQGGNVSEWIETTDGGARVIRGGSWSGSQNDLRSSFRGSLSPSSESFSTGFRVARP